VIEYGRNNKVIRVDCSGINRTNVHRFIDYLYFPRFYRARFYRDYKTNNQKPGYPLCYQEFVINDQEIPLTTVEKSSISDSVISYYNKLIQNEIENGNYDVAKMMCDGLIKSCPNNPQAWYFRGVANQRISCKENKDHIREALGDFDKAISLFPDYAAAHNYKGIGRILVMLIYLQI